MPVLGGFAFHSELGRHDRATASLHLASAPSLLSSLTDIVSDTASWHLVLAWVPGIAHAIASSLRLLRIRSPFQFLYSASLYLCSNPSIPPSLVLDLSPISRDHPSCSVLAYPSYSKYVAPASRGYHQRSSRRMLTENFLRQTLVAICRSYPWQVGRRPRMVVSMSCSYALETGDVRLMRRPSNQVGVYMHWRVLQS